MDVSPGHFLESTKGIEMIQMLIRGSAEYQNRNHILHFTWVIYPYHFSWKVVFFVMS